MARASSFLDRIGSLRGVGAAFVARVAGVAVSEDKWATLARLEPSHREELERLGFGWESFWRAEQVHGDGVEVVPDLGAARERIGAARERIVAGVDGLLSATRGVALGIYVADCAAVYLVDRASDAVGLVHSGKKGTEGQIVTRAVERMTAEFGTRPSDLEAAVSPCIRPPHYEVDFVKVIEDQLEECGVPRAQTTVSGICTGAEIDRYYSYRLEKGKTGRMLAILGRLREDREQP